MSLAFAPRKTNVCSGLSEAQRCYLVDESFLDLRRYTRYMSVSTAPTRRTRQCLNRDEWAISTSSYPQLSRPLVKDISKACQQTMTPTKVTYFRGGLRQPNLIAAKAEQETTLKGIMNTLNRPSHVKGLRLVYMKWRGGLGKGKCCSCAHHIRLMVVRLVARDWNGCCMFYFMRRNPMFARGTAKEYEWHFLYYLYIVQASVCS